MKRILLFALFLLGFLKIYAQSDVEVTVSVSQGYTHHIFYNLTTDGVSDLGNEDWDIAFSNLGSDDAGIFVNEFLQLTFGEDPPFLEIYDAHTDDFSEELPAENLTDSLYNDEYSWQFGALNSPADNTDENDFGWGIRDPETGVITGNRVYGVHMRDGTYRKLQIVSYDGVSDYTLKYANLDGSEEHEIVIDKNDYDGDLILFSLELGAVVDSPTDWDFLVGRYSAVFNVDGTFIPNAVTGFLSADGIEVIELELSEDDDPTEIDYTEYLDDLDPAMDAIGFDWKSFSLSSGWEIDPYRYYFVKTKDNHIWSLSFGDFGGYGTGDITFYKEDLGELVAVSDLYRSFAEFSVLPNPVMGKEITLAFSLTTDTEKMDIALTDITGKTIFKRTFKANKGFNVITFDAPNMTKGVYFVHAEVGNDTVTAKVIVD